MSFLDEIIEAVNSIPKMLDHKQYIEGTLYVTPEQYSVIHSWAADQPLDPCFPEPPPLMGVPVVVVKPGVPMELPSGKWLVYSIALEHFYVFPGDVWFDATGKTVNNSKRALIEG